MSRLIDERIVQMSFDNRDFEKHTKESMNTIDKLKDSMDFSDVAKSMNKSFESVDTSVLTAGLEKVSSGFSSLEIMAISVISNLTNRFVNMGVNLAKSLSIDNIATGWQKFADTSVSVGTLISQGYDMDEVTEQIKKLQFFTDETSYTFTDMVSNIGKFTAAGQDLDVSVEAMMGVANWAALSGQNASTASRAMYQLSQAMGAGVVRLQDYKSIITANMDTQEFRQQVLDTAVSVGTLTESIDGLYQTETGKTFNIDQFSKFLTEDWFTSDVLVKTLKKYSSAVDQIYESVMVTGEYDTASEAIEGLSGSLDSFGKKALEAAQEARTFKDVIDSVKEASASGFSSIFENIFGNYEEAKVLWTKLSNELYDLFVQPIKDIAEGFSLWKEAGGRDTLFANTEEYRGAFWDIYYAISEIVGIVRGTVLELFDLDTTEKISQKLLDITASIKDFTSKLVITEETTEKIKNIVTGFVSVFRFVFKLSSAITKSFKPLIDFALNNLDKIINFISEISIKFSEFVESTSLFKDVQDILTEFFSEIINVLDKLEIFETIKKTIESFFKTLNESGGNLDNIVNIFRGLFSAVSIVFNLLAKFIVFVKEKIVPVLQPILGVVWDLIPKVVGTIIKWLSALADFITNLYGLIKSNSSFSSIVEFIANALKSLGGSLGNFFSSLGSIFSSETGSKILNKLAELKEPLKNLFNSLVDLFTNVIDAVVVLMPYITSMIQFVSEMLKQSAKVLATVYDFFKNIIDKIIEKIDPDKLTNWLSGLLIAGIFVAAIIALIITFTKKTNRILRLVDAFREILRSLSDLVYAFASKIRAEAFMEIAKAVLLIAASILLLTTVDWKQGWPALIAMASVMAFVIVIMSMLNKSSEQITGLADAKKLINIAKNLTQVAGALTALGFAMIIATIPFLILGTLNWQQMGIGLIIIGGILGGLAFVNMLSKTLDFPAMLKTAGVLALLGTAFTIASVPFLILGTLNWNQLLLGLASVGIMLGIVTAIAFLFKALSPYIGYILLGAAMISVTAAALFVSALALQQLGKVLDDAIEPFKKLAKMEWSEIAKASVALLVLVTAMVTISALGPLMIGAIVTAKMIAKIGEALLILIEPIKELIEIPWTKAKTAINNLISVLSIFTIISALLGLGGTGSLLVLATSLKVFGEALVSISNGIYPFVGAILYMDSVNWGTLISNIAKFIVIALGLSVVSVVVAPAILALGVAFGVALSVIAPAILIIAAGLTMLILAANQLLKTLSYINGDNLSENIKKIINAFKEVMPDILSIIDQIIDKLIEKIPQLVDSFMYMLEQSFLTFLNTFYNSFGMIVTMLKNLIYEYGDDINSTINYFIINSIVTLLEELANNADRLTGALIKLIKKLIDGIKDNLPKLKESIKQFLTEALSFFWDIGKDVFIEFTDKMGKDIADLISELADSIARNSVAIQEAVQKLILAILVPNQYETILAFKDVGLQIIYGLAQGLKEKADEVGLGWLVDKMLEPLKKKLDIHSPSKVMEEIGEYTIMGLSNGILSKGYLIEDSMDTISNDAINSAKNSGIEDAINTMLGYLTTNIDDTIVITPVLDLSEIQNGTNSIYGLFNKANGYEFSATNSYASSAISGANNTREVRYSADNKASTTTTVREPISFVNTFNISGDNAKDIADEVSKVLQFQVERKNAKWGT